MEKLNTREIRSESRLLKQLYFVLFFVVGLIGPFASIYFKKVIVLPDGTPDIGKIKVVTTLVPLVAFVGNFFVGMITDKFKLGRNIITFLALLSIVPAVIVGYAGDFHFSHLSPYANYILLLVAFLLFSLFSRPVNSLLDSETVGFLRRYGDKRDYGKVRIWGTWGWAFITIFVGWLLSRLPYNGDVPYYSIIFYGAALSFFMMGVLNFFGRSEAEVKKVAIPWGVLNKDSRFITFLLFVFIGGVVDSAVNMQYMGYFLDEVIDSPFKIGLIFGCWTAFELPVMHFSEKIIRFLGVRKLMVLGILLTILKLFLFSLFTKDTPYLLKFGAALIHGPAFACYFLAYVDLVDSLSHEKMKATYMSIATIMRSTVAGFFGGWFGGVVIEVSQSPSALMYLGSLVMGGQLLFFLLFVKPVNDKVKKRLT